MKWTVFAIFGSLVLTAGQRNDEPASYKDGVVLVSFRGGVEDPITSAILNAVGATEIKRIGVGVHVLRIGSGLVMPVINALKMFGEIRYAEPDYLQATDGGATPNDTFAGIQWAIQNTGQTVNGVTGTAGADERLPAAWNVTTGTNSVVIAVVDTGTQYSHPDLFTNMWNNPGGIGGCAAGTHGYNILTGTCDPMDDDNNYGGHGTHVSGILGAVGNNSAGVSGVNWATSIMAVKWVQNNDTGATSDLIAAMDWVIAAKHAGVNVRVMNDSATWPGTGFSQALSDEIDLLGSNDILFVTAAGNTAQNNDVVPRYPCSYNRANMICVAAADQNDNLWSSSNYGTNTVKLAAPGVNIYSTMRVSNYGYISGTSMASPQVAGTAALILSLGYESVSSLRALILNNVDMLPGLGSFVSTGGRLNVCKAVPGCSTLASATPTILLLPIINGVPAYGSVLGTTTGLFSGGPTQYTYQWYRCASNGLQCVAIPGATSANYAVLAQADIGATLAVTVTASNSFGSASLQSNPSGIVAAASSSFSIGSTIQNGATISGILPWQATPGQTVNFVQFYIDGVLAQTVSSSPYVYTFDSIALSSGTHVAGIRALLNDNRTYGFYGATITVSNSNAPINTALPQISGTPTVGQILSTSTGAWTNNPVTYGYQWQRCDVNGANCAPISGASAGTYRLASADAGATIRSSVTASNLSGSNTASSVQVAIGVSGAITLVQSNAVEASGVGSVSVGLLSPATPGNLIIAFVRMSSTSQTVSVNDTAGNIYVDAVSQVQSTDGHQIHLFYAKNIGGGATTVSANFSSTNNHPWLAVYEYSGLSTTSPLDRTANGQGTSASVATVATGTTSSGNELLFAAAGFVNSYSGAVSPGGGYTLQQQDTGASRAGTESQVAASAGSYAGSFTLSASTNWSAVLATFAAPGAGPGPPTITTTSLPNGAQSTAYSATLTATGGASPYTWSIVSGALPAGLALASSTGMISGTPGATGTSNFTVQLTDANSQVTSKALSITIGPRAIALVQSNAVEGGGVNSVSAAFQSPNKSSNLIIAFVRMSTTSQTVSLTDTRGNMYVQAVSQAQTSDGHQVYIFYAKNIAGGSNTVTAAFSAKNNHPWLAIYEYSGLNTVNPLDQTAHAQGNSAAPNTGAVTTTSASELLFTAVGLVNNYSGTVTPGTGYSIQLQDLGTSRAATESQVVGSTGSYSGTASLSSGTNWSALLATFKQ